MIYLVEIKYSGGKVETTKFGGTKSLLNAREHVNNKRSEAQPLKIMTSKIKQAYSLYIF